MNHRKVYVKPFIPSNYSFLGLENYKMVLFDNCMQIEDLGFIEENGVKRYLTGLDEFSKDIMSIKDEFIKKTKIEEIRKTVSKLELQLAYNNIDPDDKAFWSKVKLLSPLNKDFWSKIRIKIDNTGLLLNIDTNPHDLILYHCIKAGGFSIIAPSYKIASSMTEKYLFYLDTKEESDQINTYIRKNKNKAISILQKLEENNNYIKLFYLSKILVNKNFEINEDMSISDLYIRLDDYIHNDANGDISSNFIKYSMMNTRQLYIYSLIHTLISMRKIYYKELDKQYYCLYTNSFLGSSIEEVANYLSMNNNKILLDTIIERYRLDLTGLGIKEDKTLLTNINTIVELDDEITDKHNNNENDDDVNHENNIEKNNISNVIVNENKGENKENVKVEKKKSKIDNLLDENKF